MAVFPDKFLLEAKEMLKEEYADFLSAMEEESLNALRLNPNRRNAQACAQPFLSGGSVPWEALGYYANKRARPGASLAHTAGAFYMQDPSAMAPVAALNPQPGERVLDLCAAPGGKSGQIAVRLMGKGFLLSNEIEFSRARILLSNLERLGVSNCAVTSTDAQALSAALPECFDCVLVDAPCSGEGMFRRDPNAIAEWSENAPAGCAERQAEIMDHAARLVRPGGRMAYSTCTFNRYENEYTIEAFLARHPEFEAGKFALEGVGESRNGCIRLWPHKIAGEGHFAALLMKKASAGKAERTENGKADKSAAQAAAMLLQEVLKSLPEGRLAMEGDALYALSPLAPDIGGRGVRVLRRGLPLGRVGKGYIVPEHALAMAIDPASAKNVCELTFREASDYMAGEELVKAAPKGWTLMTWQGMPLGWGKASGSVIKNHLPKGLRKRGARWAEEDGDQ